MTFNLLLKTQLERLVNKLFSQIYTMGTCATLKETIAKEVSLTGFVLKTGSQVKIRFTSSSNNNPSSGNLTLNVNSTGAKSILISETNVVCDYTFGEYFANNKVQQFVYDGTNWVWLSNIVNPLITENEFNSFS